MRTFIITILTIEAIMVVLRLGCAHQLIQGDELQKRRPSDYVIDALFGIGMIIWGLSVL
jgi:hypothetical protein